jgi:hypothetical protein
METVYLNPDVHSLWIYGLQAAIGQCACKSDNRLFKALQGYTPPGATRLHFLNIQGTTEGNSFTCRV